MKTPHAQKRCTWLVRPSLVHVHCTLLTETLLCYRQRQVSLSGAWTKLQPTAQTQSQEPINRFQSAWFAKYKGTLSNDNKVSQLSVFMWH